MRIAITGVGSVSPIGVSAAEIVGGLNRGDVGIGPAPWPSSSVRPDFYGLISDRFDPTTIASESLLEGMDSSVPFGLAACQEALEQASICVGEEHTLDPFRTAVIDGTGMGGMYSLMRGQRNVDCDVPTGKMLLRIWPNMTAAQICMRYGLHGPSLTLSTACAAALDAVALGCRLIEAGVVDVALCGGTCGGFPVPTAGPDDFVPATAVASRQLGVAAASTNPLRAVLPFDIARSGVVWGEGAGWLVLESDAHMRRRNSDAIGWIRGYGTCADSYHPTSPDPTGQWEARAMQLAHLDAQIPFDEIDLVVAHATGTVQGDLAEIKAINTVFASTGSPTTQVTALKGHTGHTGGSSGAIGLIAALGAMANGVVPAVAGTDQPDPAIQFDLVTGTSRRATVEIAQVNAFGFGGQNSSVIVSRDR